MHRANPHVINITSALLPSPSFITGVAVPGVTLFFGAHVCMLVSHRSLGTPVAVSSPVGSRAQRNLPHMNLVDHLEKNRNQ